jgi:hypothetical protein
VGSRETLQSGYTHAGVSFFNFRYQLTNATETRITAAGANLQPANPEMMSVASSTSN